MLLLVAPLGCSRSYSKRRSSPGSRLHAVCGAAPRRSFEKNIVFDVACIGMSYSGQPVRWVESLARTNSRYFASAAGKKIAASPVLKMLCLGSCVYIGASKTAPSTDGPCASAGYVQCTQRGYRPQCRHCRFGNPLQSTSCPLDAVYASHCGRSSSHKHQQAR